MIKQEQAKQFVGLISPATKILLAVPKILNPDTAGAVLGLALFLEKLKKQPEILANEDFLEKYPFLPKNLPVKTSLSAVQSLAIVINIAQKPLAEISYAKEEHKAKIFLKSNQEIFTPEDISFETQRAPYDLIIILGAQSLEDLGGIFDSNAELFFQTDKINIDNHPGNRHFGGLNLVDINSSSIAETLTLLFKEYEAELMDEDIATSLLAGIVAKTNSFQHPKVSPASFLAASELVSLGARQQEIVRALFKTKSLEFLKLWGRALAKLKEEANFTMSVLTENDFQKAGASLSQAALALKEIAENFSSKNIFAILAETQNGIKLFLASKQEMPAGMEEVFSNPEPLPGLTSLPLKLWEFGPVNMDLGEAENNLLKVLTSS